MANQKTESQIILTAKSIHVQQTLLSLGVDFQVRQLNESTRTAKEAADALGCNLGQIVKSLVFRAGETPILVLVSGSNRVHENLLEDLIGHPIKRAQADFVRQYTGYSIGGVAPVGHPNPLPTFVDEDLLRYEEVWAAAGGPFAVFGCPPTFLATLGTVTTIC
ncbi:MAG: YbaK/EbsC family protein [Bacteroidetes bacterium]|nr:YbaK/EbsC family protein [Bacteroidota bacterium]MCY4206079.1 YbaK/EbsC family protein [Bacteroidota bacterium]